jgi:hypothetical protein
MAQAKFNITLSAELKRRMMAVKEQTNWSQIAARAFEQHLAELLKRKRNLEISDVVNRLRALNAQEASEVYQTGFEAGRKWAENSARPRELKRLSRWRHSQITSWDDEWTWTDDDQRSAYSRSEDFAFTIHPDRDGDRSVADEFWKNSVGLSEQPEGEYTRGFANGALAVWDEVKGQL